jgi:hypothetical protein
MLDYSEFHARAQHGTTCPHEVTWFVEPLVVQLHDVNSFVTYDDRTYLADLINHLAAQMDEKDELLGRALVDAHRWRLIAYAVVAVTVIALLIL